MDATSILLGFLAGCFFSLVLSTFLARKVGHAVFKALKDYDASKGIHGQDDQDDPDWWKRGGEKTY